MVRPMARASSRLIWWPWLLKVAWSERRSAISSARRSAWSRPASMYRASHSETYFLERAMAFWHWTRRAGPYWLRIGSHAPSFFGSLHSFLAISNWSRIAWAGTAITPRGVCRMNCGSIGPMNECRPITIRLDAQATIVAADIAAWGMITRISENLDRR